MVYNKILIIQTAFIGDVVLATALIDKIKQHFPECKLDFLLKKGNESLLEKDPKINEVFIWDKNQSKVVTLPKIIWAVRAKKYDLVVNIQRFASSGLVAGLSGAREIVGFKQNPLSFLFHHKIDHSISDGQHEIERNNVLIQHLTDHHASKPRLFISEEVFSKIAALRTAHYLTISPSSVWYTKQWPKAKWIALMDTLKFDGTIFLLGATSDFATCEFIRKSVKNAQQVRNMCGELSMLESAALMKHAKMNFMNDSAPLHFASAVNAPTTAIFCSTVPAFGFGSLSDISQVIQIDQPLACRPCGLHGHAACPEKNFRCAHDIEVQAMVDAVSLQ